MAIVVTYPEHPLIVFALSREARFFRRHFSRQKIPGAPCRAWVGRRGERTLRVLETGVGNASGRALAWALDNLVPPPDLVVMAGFAGGLAPGLRVGDLVTAPHILDESGGVWPCSPLAVPGAATGVVLCTARVVGEPAEKAALHHRHQALAVEMESAGVARECLARGIPFACLRAISDAWSDRISPQLLATLMGERVAVGRLVLAVLRRPGLVRELSRLASGTHRAAGRLRDGLLEILGGTASLTSRP